MDYLHESSLSKKLPEENLAFPTKLKKQPDSLTVLAHSIIYLRGIMILERTLTKRTQSQELVRPPDAYHQQVKYVTNQPTKCYDMTCAPRRRFSKCGEIRYGLRSLLTF